MELQTMEYKIENIHDFPVNIFSYGRQNNRRSTNHSLREKNIFVINVL